MTDIDGGEKARKLVEFIVTEIVDSPEAVKVTREDDDLGIKINVSVSPEDMGKVIGKQRSMYESIRTLIHVIGAKSKQRISLFILEPNA